MKKFYIISALALLATAMTVSCQREMPINEPAQDAPQMRTFTCTFATPDTKISVAEDGKTKWLPGDEIMIHGGENGADRYKVTLTAGDISADGKTATIRFAMDPYDRTDAGVVSKYYAQYPASLNSEGEIYYECRFTDSNDFIMGACDVDDTFVFFNLNAVISYKVSGDFDKVVFSGNNGEVVGYDGVYQARVRNDGSGAKLTNPKFGNGSGDGTTVSSVTKVPVVDGSTINYIFIPAGVNFSEGFTFSFYKDDAIKKVARTTKAVMVDSGKLLALGDITSHLEDYVEETDPTSDHKSAITGATDLSAQQANCYLVTAAGAYKFPSKIGNTDDATANVHAVEVLWETYNNETEVTAGSVIAAVDFEDNWIYFKTPETLKPGNALIAAKNHEGKIVWSWHIWIPATTVNVIDATAYAGLKMMDRNLGALVVVDKENGAAVESCGTYYQYGRKDPFLGPKGFSSSSPALVAEGQSANILSKTAMSLGESIANPTTYAAISGGSWQSGSTSQWSFNKKTAYDPCPKGYRLAHGEKQGSTILFAKDIKTSAGELWGENADGHWFAVGDLVFPLGGYYDDSQSGETLSCTHAYDRAGIWFMPSNSSSTYHINIRIGSTYATGSTSGARGCTIRCCVDE